MSVKVIPYINENVTTALKNSVSPSDTTTAPLNFEDTLEMAERAQQALAVDALLAASNSGGVDPETIQKLLGFNPAPGAVVANTKTTTSKGTAASGSSNTTTAPTTAGNPTADTSATASTGSTSGTANSSDVLSCSAELERYFAEAAETYHVDINLLKAIAKAESNFNPNATSSAGAMGVMQLMPATAAGLGITDAYNAYDNIMGGAKVISQHLEKYNGNLSLALAAYNAGSGNVDKYGGIPPFEETQNYVKKVLSYYNS